ncbi:MAG: flagellar biosynthesis protein FliQ [Pirellula sp.]|jgi:flagellar biosynthetic protein FliQ|nr:flagellar biosynthesis protein FliQ [Pirellula sp.]MCY3010122.1 flagellar biosynthesis protein FliQ [Planctomycetota bacterium]
MTSSEAVDLIRDAIMMTLILGAPLLVIGMIVGLAIGLLQALTQIQDQTVSTVPKLVAMTLAIVVCMPWLADRMIDYSRNLFLEIPIHVASK